MRYAFADAWNTPLRMAVRRGLDGAMRAYGHTNVPATDGHIGLVFHWVDREKPVPFHRQGQATYVVACTADDVDASTDLEATLARSYPAMIRSLSNLMLAFPYRDGVATMPTLAHIVTLERGAYTVSGVNCDVFEKLYQAVAPLAQSRLVIDNVFEEDLPHQLAGGDERTNEMAWAGEQLQALNLLPAPFPIRDLLSEDDFRHVQRLYRIGGLSYGNLSMRQAGDRFWMSGSGVDKSRLSIVGRDFLLVKGYDAERNAIVLSVPPGIVPNRVSVDAIEHWMIYREHPEVGAILHIHAWVDGVKSTPINYPCGSFELAEAVATALRGEPDPGRAIIGLRNHGLTITGPSLRDIFSRIDGRVQTQVPMA